MNFALSLLMCVVCFVCFVCRLVHGLHSLGDVLAEGMFPFFIQYVLKTTHYEKWVSAIMLIGYVR